MERELIEELQALPEPEPPPDFHENLMAGVRKHAKQEFDRKMKKRRQTYTRMVIGLAASIVWAVAWVSAGFLLEPPARINNVVVAPAPAAMPFVEAYDANIYDLEVSRWAMAGADEDAPIYETPRASVDALLPEAFTYELFEWEPTLDITWAAPDTESLDIEPFVGFADFGFMFEPESTLTPAATGGRAWLLAIIGGIGPLLAGLIAVIISIKKRPKE